MATHWRRRGFTSLVAAAVLGSLGGLSKPADGEPAATVPVKRNVLFIAVDDLRPELGCYGAGHIVSPRIDALAARGAVFERAYCQQAVCAPSRVSLLTGCRPDTTRVTNLETPLASVRPDLVSLPRHFRQSGYTTVSLGKIFHHIDSDDPQAWSERPWSPPGIAYATDSNQRRLREGAADKKRPEPYEAADLPDEAYSDGKIAARAVEALGRLREEGRPFFLAVGFYRPHLPFVAPKRCWDRYDRAAIRLPDNPLAPQGTPDIAMTTWGELRSYAGVPKSGPVSDDLARTLIHGYYASVTHTDDQVGKVLDALDRLGLRESTLIVLWGDHGWQLGEHGMWCKHTNFEVAVRAPLVFAGPGVSGGRRIGALAEFVDVYPTLCELAGVKMPESPLEGVSLVPVMNDPNRPWKKAAFGQYPHSGRMGYTVTDGRYRFTRWEAGRRGGPVEHELYDHASDPAENVNLAGRQEHADAEQRMKDLLDRGWRGAMP